MSKWNLVQVWEEYVDFDKELFDVADEGDTTLDVRLTFVTDKRYAYMVVSWHNNDGNTVELGSERKLPWDAALKLLGDTPLPKELQS